MAKSNDGGGRYGNRSQFIRRVENEPTRFPSAAIGDSADHATDRHSIRKDFLKKVQNGPAQAYETLAGKISDKLCSKCYARLKQTACTENVRSKLPTLEVSRTKTSAERYKEKALRAKEKLRGCEAKYPHEHQRMTRLSGGDADRLLNDRDYMPCSNCCCPRKPHNLGPQNRRGETPAKLSSQRPHCKCFTESDTTLHLDLGDDKGHSSSIVSIKPSVREIRKVMTSRCRVHDLITASLKAMGIDDDGVDSKTQRKEQSPAQHHFNRPPRRTNPLPRHNNPPHRDQQSRRHTQPVFKPSLNSEEEPQMFPRKLTRTTNVTHTEDADEVKVERKLQMLYEDSKYREMPLMDTTDSRRGPQTKERTKQIQRRDNSPVSKPPPNAKKTQLIPTKDLNHTRDDFEKTILNKLHVEVIYPIIKQLDKMHCDSLCSQLCFMGDLAALPKKASKIFKEYLQNPQDPK